MDALCVWRSVRLAPFGVSRKNTWSEALELAFEQAKRRLLGLWPEEVQERAWVVWKAEKGLWEVPFFGRSFKVLYPSCEVYGPEGERVDKLKEVLLLHYLLQAKGTGISGKWVDFRRLPGGLFYFPVFRNRIILPLVKAFGGNPEGLLLSAQRIGGEVIPVADACVSLKAFPQVVVAFGIWKGKEGFGPEGIVLFDQRAPDHLSTEDLIWVCHEAIGLLRA